MFDSLLWDAGLFAGETDEDETAYRLTVEADQTSGAREVDVLPAGLDEIGPGLFLAGILASVDPGRLTGFGLVCYVQARERLVSHHHAGLYAGICELAYASDPDTPARDSVPVEFASEELQAGLVKTRRSADYELGLALDLCERIPQVWEALDEGRIDLARARVFADETETLTTEIAAQVVDQVLAAAPGSTTGQLRARLKRRIITADPAGAEDQYQSGLEDRRMMTAPNPDHTASIGIHGIRPEDAILASEYVHALAMVLKRRPGETRSIDQIRADVATDLLTGRTPETVDRVTPQIVVHITDPTTGHIPGYGPILPTSLHQLIDNQLVESASTERQSDETTPLDETCHQTTARRPSTSQIRHVRSRYPTCIFPGCRMPAEKCDLDHRHQYSKDGKTTCLNLAPLCRHHHTCKDQTNWKLTRNSDNSHTWTSPLGHTYTTGRPP